MTVVKGANNGLGPCSEGVFLIPAVKLRPNVSLITADSRGPVTAFHPHFNAMGHASGGGKARQLVFDSSFYLPSYLPFFLLSRSQFSELSHYFLNKELSLFLKCNGGS